MINSPKGSSPRHDQDPTRALSLLSVANLLWRRKWALIVPLVVSSGFAIVWSRQLPATYQARTLMMLDSPRSQGRVDPLMTVRAQLGSIRETLNRRSLLEAVIIENGLYESEDGEVAEADLESMRSRIEIGVEGDQTFHLLFTDTDAERAAGSVNRLGQLLVEETDAARTYRAQMLVELIGSEVDDAEAELVAKQQALERQRESSATPVSENLDIYLGSLSMTSASLQETNRSIASAEAQRATFEAELRQFDQLRSQPSSGSSSILSDPRRAELQGQLDRALERGYRQDHPTVARLMSDIAALDRESGGDSADASSDVPTGDWQLRYIQTRASIEGIDSQLEFLREEKRDLIEALSQFQQRADTDSEQEQTMSALLRDYEVTRTRYLALLEQLDNARFQASLEGAGAVSGLRVAEVARIPQAPSGPRRMRLAGLGVLAGLAIGLAAVLAFHQLDSSFSDVSDLRTVTSLPTLAAIPSMRQGFLRRRGASVPTLSQRTSVASEQYRILASRLRHEMDRECARILLVTSGAGGEGKTTTAINLAVALSQIQDERVLLLDADLRRPSVRKEISAVSDANLGTDEGFLDLMSSSKEVAPEFFGRVDKLFVLAGSSRSTDSLSAIVSDSAKVVLARLRKRFKYIIIDAPPVLPMVDSHLLSELADKVLLLVRANQTRRESLDRTLDSFDSSRILGLVLNDVDFASARYSRAYRKYIKDYLPKDKWTARIRIL